MNACAVLVAAGSGRRFGAAKQFLPLAGKPLLHWPLRALERTPEVKSIVLVVARERVAWGEKYVRRAGFRKVTAVVAGGAERADSVRAGVLAAPAGTQVVLIHDAARALVTPEVVSRVARAALKTGAALAAWPLPDTLKLASSAGGFVRKTVPRKGLWLAQTPQGFRRDAADRLFRRPAKGVTDDAQLAEKAGLRTALVPASPANFKVTLPEDFEMCRALVGKRFSLSSWEARKSARGRGHARQRVG